MIVIVNDDGSLEKLARATDSIDALADAKRYLNSYGEDAVCKRNVEVEIFKVDVDDRDVDIVVKFPDGTVGKMNLELHSDGYKWVTRT